MNDELRSSGRRRSRLLGTALLVGGLAVAGGAAHTTDGGAPDARPEAAGVVQPGSAVPVPAAAEAEPAPVATDDTDLALDAYFGAGYDYDDAVALAALWDSGSEVDAKISGGQMLLAGEELPIAPGSAEEAVPVPDVSYPAVDAFFGAGYDYDDAVALADLWGTATPYDAKVAAGGKLLAGEALPVRP